MLAYGLWRLLQQHGLPQRMQLRVYVYEYVWFKYDEIKATRYTCIEDDSHEAFVVGGRWVFAFEMKFYPTEPATLHEDLTR